jgi:hypothetical protein
MISIVLHLDFHIVTRIAQTPPDIVITLNESSDMVKDCKTTI